MTEAKKGLASLGLDEAIRLRWALRDIKAKRSKFSRVDPSDLRTLIEMGYVVMQSDARDHLQEIRPQRASGRFAGPNLLSGRTALNFYVQKRFTFGLRLNCGHRSDVINDDCWLRLRLLIIGELKPRLRYHFRHWINRHDDPPASTCQGYIYVL
jgi:hypothetical protein